VSTVVANIEDIASEVGREIEHGSRFAGLMGIPSGDTDRLIVAVTVSPAGEYRLVESSCPEGSSYPSLVDIAPSADWYEHKLAEQCGVHASGRRMEKDILLDGGNLPKSSRSIAGDELFVLHYGPVRSGVVEAIEYELHTPGEDIPLMIVHPGYKHRGIESHLVGASADQAVRTVERVEGVASVAHALAFSLAVEALSPVAVPPRAWMLRIVHAELERIANHLKVAVMLAEAAGLAVANARFSYELELIQQLRGTLCGSRFSRGVVVPGGVMAPLSPLDGAASRVAHIRDLVYDDAVEAMSTPSFIDRIRHAGKLPADLARDWGAVGVLARGSLSGSDTRSFESAPYAQVYRDAGYQGERSSEGCDALARQEVRWEEVWDSFSMIKTALGMLDGSGDKKSWRAPTSDCSGMALGVFEAPQGECLYLVKILDGRVAGCSIRSASFHDLQLFPLIFGGDIFTDFAFNEASMEVSAAGASL
jgi:Ni,Fe-hydrogenase III large subunit